jgi:hypothetical protein
VGNAVLWEGSDGAINNIGVWTQDRGAQILIGYGNDLNQGAADIGSDSDNLVWSYGSKATSTIPAFANVDIMTAPFTTDPSKVVPRRLRSEFNDTFGVSAFHVGCGYALHSTWLDPGLPTQRGGLRLVRLKDGQSWLMMSTNADLWIWGDPIAVTCDEVFAIVRVRPDDASSPVMTIARIRMDSLGPGIPPD